MAHFKSKGGHQHSSYFVTSTRRVSDSTDRTFYQTASHSYKKYCAIFQLLQTWISCHIWQVTYRKFSSSDTKIAAALNPLLKVGRGAETGGLAERTYTTFTKLSNPISTSASILYSVNDKARNPLTWHTLSQLDSTYTQRSINTNRASLLKHFTLFTLCRCKNSKLKKYKRQTRFTY